LIWAFSGDSSAVEGWFILPMTGGLKVGFEDYYSSSGKKVGGAKSDDLVIQFLNGKKLQPDREYFIWFGANTNQVIDLKASLRFVPAGTVDPNKPAELANTLRLPLNGDTRYIRHFCLGAIR
jgi:hypothetical protein